MPQYISEMFEPHCKTIREIFEPRCKTIREIFDGINYYQIPDYQREYSWKDEQIEELWDDVYNAFENRDESYFLGPAILIEKEGYFEVVDGQQRITTLTILFCVLRDSYFPNDKRIQNAIKSLVEGKFRLRLITQSYHQNEFEQKILNGVNFPQRELTKKERAKMKFINAALIFDEKLKAIDKNEERAKFLDYLLNKVVMITITCPNQSLAIKLFQVINTRGLDLTHADLVKSYLYSRLEESKKKQFVSTWDEITTIIVSLQGEGTLTDILTYYEYYLLASNPKHSLFEELENQFKNKDPNEVVFDFRNFVKIYHDIVKDTTSKVINSFWYLPNQVFWKSILITAKKVNYPSFSELCKELRRFYYSYWIAGYITSKIKQPSFNIIGWVKSKKTLQEIRVEIDKKMGDDHVINRMKGILENDAYGCPWLKPLLILVEYEQTDESKVEYIDIDRKLQVDHILPQGWQSIESWKEKFTDKSPNEWLDKIGNLTLLSGKKNIKASNDSFKHKKKIYKGKGIDDKATAFRISQDICDKADWTEREIAARQDQMIRDVEKILDVTLCKVKGDR